MKKTIVKIDKEKCIGCGLCVNACQQGAIGLVDGKAKLLNENHCDGLGKCLPNCPMGAITLEEREITELKTDNTINNNNNSENEKSACSCAGNRSAIISHENKCQDIRHNDNKSELMQWPVQIKLAPVNAPYFNNANLLIAADCTAYAYGDFHNRFMKNKITLIGCPKLDNVDYCDKLTAILKNNDIKSLTIIRMEVPCCNGIVNSAKKALQESGKFIPWQIITITTDGKIID